MNKFKKKLIEIFEEIRYELTDINMSLRTITNAFASRYDTPYNVLHIKEYSDKE